MVLAHCNYTLVKGQQTASDYDLQAIEKQLHRRFLAGKPRIQTVSKLSTYPSKAKHISIIANYIELLKTD